MTSISSLPSPPASREEPPKRNSSFIRLLAWACAPMVMWFATANGLAYYLSSRQDWPDVPHTAVVVFSLVTLYAVPWVLTFVAGLMAWGYSLHMYGSGKGTYRAFLVFAWQWFVVWALTKASIHWHYVYFYTEQSYF